MVHLCQNRPEAFGPHSNIHPNLPTTCFLDVIVIPLATWLYLLASPVLVLSIVRSRKNAFKADTTLAYSTVTAKILIGLYCFLTIAMLAMISLVIARLVKARLGIGLLPFTYAGVLLAAFVHFSTTKRSILVRVLDATYWVMLAVAMALHVAALVEEEGSHNRIEEAGGYPLGDEVTDYAVMVGAAVILAGLEVVA